MRRAPPAGDEPAAKRVRHAEGVDPADVPANYDDVEVVTSADVDAPVLGLVQEIAELVAGPYRLSPFDVDRLLARNTAFHHLRPPFLGDAHNVAFRALVFRDMRSPTQLAPNDPSRYVLTSLPRFFELVADNWATLSKHAVLFAPDTPGPMREFYAVFRTSQAPIFERVPARLPDHYWRYVYTYCRVAMRYLQVSFFGPSTMRVLDLIGEDLFDMHTFPLPLVLGDASDTRTEAATATGGVRRLLARFLAADVAQLATTCIVRPCQGEVQFYREPSSFYDAMSNVVAARDALVQPSPLLPHHRYTRSRFGTRTVDDLEADNLSVWPLMSYYLRIDNVSALEERLRHSLYSHSSLLGLLPPTAITASDWSALRNRATAFADSLFPDFESGVLAITAAHGVILRHAFDDHVIEKLPGLRLWQCLAAEGRGDGSDRQRLPVPVFLADPMPVAMNDADVVEVVPLPNGREHAQTVLDTFANVLLDRLAAYRDINRPIGLPITLEQVVGVFRSALSLTRARLVDPALAPFVDALDFAYEHSSRQDGAFMAFEPVVLSMPALYRHREHRDTRSMLGVYRWRVRPVWVAGDTIVGNPEDAYVFWEFRLLRVDLDNVVTGTARVLAHPPRPGHGFFAALETKLDWQHVRMSYDPIKWPLPLSGTILRDWLPHVERVLKTLKDTGKAPEYDDTKDGRNEDWMILRTIRRWIWRMPDVARIVAETAAETGILKLDPVMRPDAPAPPVFFKATRTVDDDDDDATW